MHGFPRITRARTTGSLSMKEDEAADGTCRAEHPALSPNKSVRGSRGAFPEKILEEDQLFEDVIEELHIAINGYRLIVLTTLPDQEDLGGRGPQIRCARHH